MDDLSVVGDPLAVVLSKTKNCSNIIWFSENNVKKLSYVGYRRLNTSDGDLKAKMSNALLEENAFDE